MARKENGAGNSRTANVIATLKWIIPGLETKGIVFPHLDLLSIKKPRIIKQETNYLTEAEVARFLSGAVGDIEKRPTVKNVRFMTLAVFLLQTGARIREALSINIADIDRPNKEMLGAGINVVQTALGPRRSCHHAQILCRCRGKSQGDRDDK
jgi:integrase